MEVSDDQYEEEKDMEVEAWCAWLDRYLAVIKVFRHAIAMTVCHRAAVRQVLVDMRSRITMTIMLLLNAAFSVCDWLQRYVVVIKVDNFHMSSLLRVRFLLNPSPNLFSSLPITCSSPERRQGNAGENGRAEPRQP